MQNHQLLRCRPCQGPRTCDKRIKIFTYLWLFYIQYSIKKTLKSLQKMDFDQYCGGIFNERMIKKTFIMTILSINVHICK